MIAKLKTSIILKSSILYVLAALVNAAIPFLLIPFLSARFNPEEYGKIAMATIAINILTPIIGVSAHGAIHRKYFENHENFPRYIGNAFLLLIVSSIVILIGLFVFKPLLEKVLLIPFYAILYVYIISIAQFIIALILVLWQAKNESINYARFQILLSLFNFTLTLLFIYSLNLAWDGRILAQLIAVVFFSLIAVFILYRNKEISVSYNKEDLRDILKFSFPLIPHTLGGLAIAFTDRFLISQMIGVAETGLYTLAFQIGSVLNIINTSFINAYVPWLYRKLDQNDESEKFRIVRITYVFFLVQMVIVFFGVFLVPFVFNYFISSDYKASISLCFGILVGYAFNGMYLMVAGFIFYIKKTNYLSIVTFIMAILNIPICYFSLLRFGTIGASYSMSVIYFLYFIVTWYLCFKLYKMPWFKFK